MYSQSDIKMGITTRNLMQISTLKKLDFQFKNSVNLTKMKHLIYILALSALPLTSINSQIDIKEVLFENGNYFEKGSTVFTISLGLVSDIKIDSVLLSNDGIEPKLSIPAINIEFEKQIWKNVGISGGGTYRSWTIPVFEYRYHYFNFNLKSNYHFNIHEDLDAYLGIGMSYKRMVATNALNAKGNGSISLAYNIGVKYYFTDQLGIYAAIGNDSLSLIKIGVSLYF
ncbi:MAG: hypothetical protein ACI86M_002092 [Saprospiraceae bacterium]|jgi:hypothetical protein